MRLAGRLPQNQELMLLHSLSRQMATLVRLQPTASLFFAAPARPKTPSFGRTSWCTSLNTATWESKALLPCTLDGALKKSKEMPMHGRITSPSLFRHTSRVWDRLHSSGSLAGRRDNLLGTISTRL